MLLHRYTATPLVGASEQCVFSNCMTENETCCKKKHAGHLWEREKASGRSLRNSERVGEAAESKRPLQWRQ